MRFTGGASNTSLVVMADVTGGGDKTAWWPSKGDDEEVHTLTR